MGSEALLRAACERAFSVARDGYEADPSVEPPEAMRSFLYVARLPRRAITIAQKALENDETFRESVAEGATVSEVGQAGHLWLCRPAGWRADFENLKDEEGEKIAKQAATAGGTGKPQTPTIPPPPGFEPEQFATEIDHSNGAGETLQVNVGKAGDDMGDANAIEHELSSLRGLVDRLASERSPAALHSSGVGESEADSDSRTYGDSADSNGRGSSEVASLRAVPAESLRNLESELDQAIADRDEARRKHSDSLTQQLELEKELSKLRDGRKDVDSAQVESDNRLVESRKELARITANRDEAERQRQATVEQMTGLNTEINTLRGEMKAAVATRKHLESQIAELEAEGKKAQGEGEQAEVRAQELVVSNDDLSRRLLESEQEIERLRVELDGFADLARRSDNLEAESEELADELTKERQLTESIQTELDAQRDEVATLRHQVSEAKGDHDGMAHQVVTLQQSLGEALTDLGESRQNRDSDRLASIEYRTERDELKVELARLQEVDSERTAKLDELMAEQSAHASLKQRAAELEERVVASDVESNKLKADLTRIISERDKATTRLGAQEEELSTLRADAKSYQEESSGSKAALEKAEKSLEDVRVERETLATQLSEAEQRATAADSQAAKYQDQLAEALSNLGTIQLEIDNQEAEIESTKTKLEEERKRVDEYKISSETHEKNLLKLQDSEQAVVTGLRSEVRKLTDKLQSDETSLAQSGKELRRTRGDLEKAEGDLATAQTALEEARSELASVKSETATSDSLRGRSSIASESSRVTDTQEVPASAAAPDSVLKAKSDNDISDGSGVASLIRSVPTGGDVDGDQAYGRSSADLRSESKDDTASEDELDELSNIISQKMTSFTGGTDPRQVGKTKSGRDDVMFFGERGTNGDEAGLARPPSVFSTGELASISESAGEDSDVTFQPLSDAPISAVSPLKSPSTDDSDADSLVSVERRTIDIPAEIAKKGGVELARFVVESPEIVLLVDGDSVAKMGWSSRAVGEQREALVSWLADLTASTGASSDVVFDGRIGDDAALPASRVVSIRLSTPPTEPAAALDELIDAYPPQFPVAVVSDNGGLKEIAQERGAVALSNAQLLDLFTPE